MSSDAKVITNSDQTTDQVVSLSQRILNLMFNICLVSYRYSSFLSDIFYFYLNLSMNLL